jgi:hypothetical protein
VRTRFRCPLIAVHAAVNEIIGIGGQFGQKQAPPGYEDRFDSACGARPLLIVSKSADDTVTPPLKLGITSFLTACSPRPQKSYRFAALENIEQQA